MTSTAPWIVCKAFMQKCDSKKRELLSSYLSPSEKALLDKASLPAQLPPQECESIFERLSQIHSSWFTPFLRTLSENEIRLFLSSLTEKQAKELKKILGLSNNLSQLTPFAQRFFQEHLYAVVKEREDLLPISLLPSSSLNALLGLDSETLDLLIDYLGLHDLAIELRFVIDTSKLKKIYEALSKEEVRYLKGLMHQIEPISFKRINLDQWDGNIEKIKTIVKQRGINRLAKALYGQDSSLIWYVQHHLDTEKGASFRKLCVSLEHPKASLILAEQVLNVAQYLKNQRTL